MRLILYLYILNVNIIEMTFANFDFEEYNDGYVNVSFTNDKITKESFNDF